MSRRKRPDVTIDDLRILAKRYRLGELEATGELVALGTTRVDELARAYGLERASDETRAQLAEAHEKKGDEGVARRVVQHIERHQADQRAAARAMRLRAVRVLCPRRRDGAWSVETSEVLACSDGRGEHALVAFGDDVYTLPRSRVHALPVLLRGARDVAWRIEPGPAPLLECRYTTTHGKGRVRFVLTPIEGAAFVEYLPEGTHPTDEVRRTFGRSPEYLADLAAARAESERHDNAVPIEAPAAPHADAYVSPDYERGLRSLDGESPAYIRGVEAALAALRPARAPRTPKLASVTTPEELTARRKEAARKAVETRRARLAAAGAA